MSGKYFEYVLACYAVFALMLAWGFIAPRLRIARELRAARRREAKGASPASRQSVQGELHR